MLQSLRVKNFALIDELEVEFGKGLNILTGETGAGKSILLGSIMAALGEKTSKDVIRTGADSAFVELDFEEIGPQEAKILADFELSAEDDRILLSKKMSSSGKSISRINGEVVNAATVKAVAAGLLEIHGQQEHHTLLNAEKHLELLDRFGGEPILNAKNKVKTLYEEYKAVHEELVKAQEDSTNKNRDCSFLEFAVKEIEEADYKAGENDELEQKFTKLSHSKALSDGVSLAMDVMTEGSGDTAESQVSSAIKALSRISGFDSEAEKLLSAAEEISSLLSDFHHEASSYLDSLSEYEEEYETVSERLTLFNRLKSKYGKTMEDVLGYAKECREKLERYADYDTYLAGLQSRMDKVTRSLSEACAVLSKEREDASLLLCGKIRSALSDLNFLQVRFEIRMEKTDFSSNGTDRAEFMIATNPGEEIRPLIKIASGGELSRIMLAIKSVFAEKDEIPTMIFDEIDTGISGRTAQMVSEKMAEIAEKRQLLCITHLPQIAAMADTHFYIEKTTDGQRTITQIHKLDEEASAVELARMLGGAEITDTVLSNAKEMKQLSKKKK